jgi:dephospho-CoA kinase
MIRIALVGSIGSGKTFISNLFGYPVFNADESVNKIYSNNKKIFYKLKKKIT